MFIFLLQVRSWVEDHSGEVYLFALFSAIVWALWLVKVTISRRYRPWTDEHLTTSSVVIPVVDEPLDLFRDVLGRIVEQQPHEVIVVINGKRNLALEEVCAEFEAVHHVWTPVPGKRNAVRIGVERSTGDVVVLVDSDTLWTASTLPELVKPFADPRVGGVTTRQRILRPDRCFLTRWADWLENSRCLYSMPTQSVLGQVGCLPGRTIAFRRGLLLQVMPQFLSERFLGIFLEVSDDRTLTNLTLKAGYRTVFQYTSLVYTDAPTNLRILYKQQLRWARGSQYNTLRMLPWMLGHAPLLALFFLCDIALPFLLAGAASGWVYRSVTQTGYNYYQPLLDELPGTTGLVLVIAGMVVTSWLSMVLRQLRHLNEKPRDALLMPAFVIFSSLFLMPVRLLGFFRMAHDASWGTRADSYTARQDQRSPGASAAAVGAQAPGPPDGSRPDAHPAVPRHDGDEVLLGLPPRSPHGPASSTAVLTVPRAAPAAVHSPAAQPAAAVRPPVANPLAALPYVIGALILVVEALTYV